MAEINIEKKSSPVWPWVLLILLVIAGAIWYFYEKDKGVVIDENDNRTEQYEDDTTNYDNDLTP